MQPPPRRNCDPGPITPSRRERPLRAPLPVEEGDSEQPGTWVTVLTGDMGNMFQFLFMLH